MTRFTFKSAVAINAATLDDAYALMEQTWGSDDWWEIAPCIEVFSPDPEPEDVQEGGDLESECICPPEMIGRGGFRGSCPAEHGVPA